MNSTHLTWKGLAAALHIDARTLRLWRGKPGAPTTPDLQAWRAYLEKSGLGDHANVLTRLRLARLEEVQERVRRLKRENEWGDRALVKRSEMDERDQQIALRQKAMLYSKMENELPILCEGGDCTTIRRHLRSAADEICDLMQDMLAAYEYSGPPRVADEKGLEKKLETHDEEKD